MRLLAEREGDRDREEGKKKGAKGKREKPSCFR
jgi:hypothetical protein